MKSIAIIPARGGSKRIPRKNIKDFLGKPIITYPIETAINSQLFSKVIVSTDDKNIADISEKHGAQIPFLRSNKNSDDFATINDVFVEVINWFNNNNEEFDFYCIILPTTPLLSIDLLKQGFDFLKNSDFDSIRPIVRYNYPIQRSFKVLNGKVEFISKEYCNTRSQDLEPAFHDAGMFYFIKKGFNLMGNNKGAFEIESILSQDIDNEDDWRIAEFKYQYNLRK